MPITGRSLLAAAKNFADHINGVLAKTVTQSPVIAVATRTRAQLTFRQRGRPVTAALRTEYGSMHLYFGQVCESVVTAGVHRLHTVNYKYTITPDGEDQPLLRWEYVRDPEAGAFWCRHHLQGPVRLIVNERGDEVSLNDWHLPTGYVPFEEVLRFCITDLGVEPLSKGWHDVLVESYEQFKKEFVQ